MWLAWNDVIGTACIFDSGDYSVNCNISYNCCMARINFDLQQLQAFILVADRGSFRAAADQLHLSPPALSRRIERLETALGARLLNRTTREVSLTSLGRNFLERARAALDDLETAMLGMTELSVSRTGLVTVACVPSAALFFLPSVLGVFAARYPGVRVRVVDESTTGVIASVTSGESDFGISLMGSRIPEIDFEPIYNDPFVLALRREHRLASRSSVAWSELEGEKLIAVARSSGNRQILDHALTKAGLRPSIALEVNHIATLLGMVEAGLGVATVPQMAITPLHSTLVAVRLRNPAVSRRLGLVMRHGATLRPAADAFRTHLRVALKARKKNDAAAPP
jgi:DNA-binding transcriptional LysR family regulator